MTLVEIFDIDDMIMSTTSYYLGRRTIQTGDFCERLVRAWPQLSGGVKRYVKTVVNNAFAHDDFVRNVMDVGTLPLGDDCDRASWETVRNLWREEECDGVC